MPLTDAAIRKAKASLKPIRLFDGGGLYLEIAPSGGKWWRLKYRYAGKEKRISLIAGRSFAMPWPLDALSAILLAIYGVLYPRLTVVTATSVPATKARLMAGEPAQLAPYRNTADQNCNRLTALSIQA